MRAKELQAIRERVEHDKVHPYAADYDRANGKIVARFSDGRIERKSLNELDGPYVVAQPKMRLQDIPNLLAEIDRLTNENTYHSTQLDRAREEIQRLRNALVMLKHPASYYVSCGAEDEPNKVGEICENCGENELIRQDDDYIINRALEGATT